MITEYFSWILDKYGLRVSVLLGAGGNCLGSWLKVLSAQPGELLSDIVVVEHD